MSENAILYLGGILIAWNAWVSIALIKIMVDVAVIKKQLSGELL